MQKREARSIGHICDRWVPNSRRNGGHTVRNGSWRRWWAHTFQCPVSVANVPTDLIELGLPFTDPIADGPTIQKSNTQALKNGITVESTLETVRKARRRGLRAPVLFMGYYNPLLSYGEERLLQDAKDAGVNGFIVVDLPPEEAIRFRNFCTKGG